jgi:hypothetical protein
MTKALSKTAKLELELGKANEEIAFLKRHLEISNSTIRAMRDASGRANNARPHVGLTKADGKEYLTLPVQGGDVEIATMDVVYRALEVLVMRDTFPRRDGTFPPRAEKVRALKRITAYIDDRAQATPA